MEKSIYEVIKNLRMRKMYSQADMADFLNMTQNAYSKLERGVTTMTVDRLLEICNILQIDPSMLIDYYRSENIQNYQDYVAARENSDTEELYEVLADYRHVSDQKAELEKQMNIMKARFNQLLLDKEKIISLLEDKVKFLEMQLKEVHKDKK